MVICKSIKSNKFFLVEDFLESRVAVTGGSDKARNGDKIVFAEVNGTIGIHLSQLISTSQTESCTEEWSLEVMILSV